jgi:hypothetical protein
VAVIYNQLPVKACCGRAISRLRPAHKKDDGRNRWFCLPACAVWLMLRPCSAWTRQPLRLSGERITRAVSYPLLLSCGGTFPGSATTKRRGFAYERSRVGSHCQPSLRSLRNGRSEPDHRPGDGPRAAGGGGTCAACLNRLQTVTSLHRRNQSNGLAKSLQQQAWRGSNLGHTQGRVGASWRLMAR